MTPREALDRAIAALPPRERVVETLAAMATVGFARAVTGVRPNWIGCEPEPGPRIYFANHSSHGDFVLIWTVLPPSAARHDPAGRRAPTTGRPLRCAASSASACSAPCSSTAIPPDAPDRSRHADERGRSDTGLSLILFPEGTRNTTEEQLLPFKSGLYHLAKARPEAELVPVWIENLNRVMPKGEFVPVPLLCTVTFGAPLTLGEGEDKAAFLDAQPRRAPRHSPRSGGDEPMTPLADHHPAVRRHRRPSSSPPRWSGFALAQRYAAAGAQLGHRQPQRPHQGLVGDGGRDRRRVCVRQGRRDRAVRLRLVHGAARVPDADRRRAAATIWRSLPPSSWSCRCSTI